MGRIPQRGRVRFKFRETDRRLTSHGGLFWMLEQAWRTGLRKLLSAVGVKRRDRGADDGEMLLSAVLSLSAGGRSLSDVDALRSDPALSEVAGRIPDARRLGEYLSRVDAGALERLRDCCREVARQAIPLEAARCMDETGHVPVFVDGTTLELTGGLFEGAARGYDASRCLRLSAVYVGRVLASVRLHPGNAAETVSWGEQLAETAAMLPASARPWLLADNAYYRKDVVAFCRARGWDYAVSVSHGLYKAPVVDLCPGPGADCWEPMEDPDERGAYVEYAPAGWRRLMPAGWDGEHYLVIERRADARGQLFLEPQHAVILTSRADCSPASVAAVHRAKQGLENAWKDLLCDLGLHRPRCRSLAANRAWLCCAHLAQMLLRTLQLQILPEHDWTLGVGSLIRRFMRAAACLVRRGRTWILLFPDRDRHIRWHRLAAARFGLNA